jgi:hypothetical protein
MAWDSKPKKDFTYVGIGSFPHRTLEPHLDQLIPVFLRNLLKNTGKTVRVIHIDPFFAEKGEFLDSYFSKEGLKRVDDMTWANDRVEVCVYARNYDDDEEPALSAYLDTILDQGSELVLQMYTGRDSVILFRKMYRASSNPRLFLKKILFDITYGTDCSCTTDMTKHDLIYNGDGFLNLQLYGPEEAAIVINRRTHPTARAYFVRVAWTEYKDILNNYHVDYRRRLRGEGILFEGNYASTIDPDDLMKLLHWRLDACMNRLVELGEMGDAQIKKQRDLFGNYREYDVYKWYSEMDAIVKEMAH